MAQFFTPMPLCELMARMTIDETAPENARIADPACGSGRLLMACIRLRPRGYYFGVDKDPTCAKMAALNMLWRNVDSHIVWGNSLSLTGAWRLDDEQHHAWRDRSGASGRILRRTLLEASVRAMETSPVPAEKVEAGVPETATADIPKLVNVRGQFEMDL